MKMKHHYDNVLHFNLDEILTVVFDDFLQYWNLGSLHPNNQKPISLLSGSLENEETLNMRAIVY